MHHGYVRKLRCEPAGSSSNGITTGPRRRSAGTTGATTWHASWTMEREAIFALAPTGVQRRAVQTAGSSRPLTNQ